MPFITVFELLQPKKTSTIALPLLIALSKVVAFSGGFSIKSLGSLQSIPPTPRKLVIEVTITVNKTVKITRLILLLITDLNHLL